MRRRATTAVSIPDTLESSQAKLVYLYLSVHGGTTVDELQKGLSMSKLALYSVLRVLDERDLIRREADRYVPAR